MERLILASSSPRRKQLLNELGWEFEVCQPDFNEIRENDESAEEMILRFAISKAESVSKLFSDAWIVAADTIVLLNNVILGKPQSKVDAVGMLTQLQGKKHYVLTAVSVMSPKGRKNFIERTQVKFRALSEKEISAYVALGESNDKAGAYAIQGHGMLLVEQIYGDYYNVVGLPIVSLSKVLDELGFTLESQWRK